MERTLDMVRLDRILENAEMFKKRKDLEQTKRNFLFSQQNPGKTLEHFEALFPDQRTLDLMRGTKK